VVQKMSNKSILYYTENRLDATIMKAAQLQMLKSGLPIVSVSLKPLNFGENFVINLEPGVITMFRQILHGLERSEAKVIFMGEHDVLYHPSHFDFTPPKDDTYYYNTNVWKWWYPKDYLITYDFILSVSGLCASRELLLDHYRQRLKAIEDNGWQDDSPNPYWVRKMGYEPGKKRIRGGFLDEKVEEWRPQYPNIDLRHRNTHTPLKVTLNRFRCTPTNWKETTLENVPGWGLKEIFNL